MLTNVPKLAGTGHGDVFAVVRKTLTVGTRRPSLQEGDALLQPQNGVG
jgi:hypothetical protein